jgi:hypothetical protein
MLRVSGQEMKRPGNNSHWAGKSDVSIFGPLRNSETVEKENTSWVFLVNKAWTASEDYAFAHALDSALVPRSTTDVHMRAHYWMTHMNRDVAPISNLGIEVGDAGLVMKGGPATKSIVSIQSQIERSSLGINIPDLHPGCVNPANRHVGELLCSCL